MPQLKLPDAVIHYVQAGQKAVSGNNELVMLHGLAANLSLWYFGYAPGLADRFHITMVDLRGHGRSGMPKAGYAAERIAEDIIDLLDALGIEKAHLIGHSFGGAVLAHLASRHPERVCSLTLIDTRFRAFQPSRHDQRVGDEAGWELLEHMARRRVHNAAGATESGRIFAGAGGLQTARRWLDLLSSTSAREDLTRGDGLSREAIAQIRAPILAVYGERSPTLVSAQALCDCLPQTKLVIIPGAGHFFPLNRREALLAILQTHLNESLDETTPWQPTKA